MSVATVGAIAFDMDGVLVDSSEAHRWAFDQALVPYGLTVDYPTIAGQRTADVMGRLGASIGLSDEEVARLTETKQALAFRRLREEPVFPVFPYAARVVSELAVRYPIALCTSASRRTMELFLDRSGCRCQFVTTVCGDDVARAKPDPEIYVLATSRLGCAAARMLVVEDSSSGLAAGIAAGCPVAHVDSDCAGSCDAQVCVAGLQQLLVKLDTGA